MSKESVILCVVYVLYLLFGGLIFKYSQWDEEEEVIVRETPQQWISLIEILKKGNSSTTNDADQVSTLVAWLLEECPNLPNETYHQLQSRTVNESWIVQNVEQLCNKLVEEIEIKYHYLWTFSESVFFSMTVTTTIGYGYIYPVTKSGRIICILYSIIGIPLTMILLTWTSGFFGERLFNFFKSKVGADKQESRTFIAIASVIYINVGFLCFIFLPAIIFAYIEDWSYLNSVYFAFITLTTIGFGDLVTGTNIEGRWVDVYQIFVILWILAGLGYWVMVANFITIALNSREMAAFAKRVTDVKKLMTQVGLVQNDPKFVTHTSKATMNFMLQLSNAIVSPDEINKSEVDAGTSGSSTATASTPVSPGAIPGIAALFGKAGVGVGGASLFNDKQGIGLFSPMQKTTEGIEEKTCTMSLLNCEKSPQNTKINEK